MTLVYFAWVRQKIGKSEEHLALPGDIKTVDALAKYLHERGPGYASAFADRRTVRCAVNQEFADPDSRIGPGDEVAFFPPVTGG